MLPARPPGTPAPRRLIHLKAIFCLPGPSPPPARPAPSASPPGSFLVPVLFP